MANTVEVKQRTPHRDESGGPPGSPRRPAVISAAVLLVAFVAIGGVLCFLGIFVRPASDDFRFIVIERRDGFLGASSFLYSSLTGRVGNGLFVGLAYLSPDWGLRLTPTVALLSLAVAGALLAHALLARAGAGAHPLAAPLAGLGTAVLALVMQPRAYHTLYWTAGVITHTLPPALVTGLAGVALLARSHRARLWTGAAAVPVGVLLGTTSETISAAVLILVVLAGIGQPVFAGRATWPPAFGVVLGASTVVGAVIVLTSPGHAAALRQRTHGEALVSSRVLADTVATWEKALSHLSTDAALPAAAAIGFVVCLLARTHRPIPAGRLLFALVAAGAGVLALTFAVMWELRVGWGPGGWRFYRAWFAFQYAAVLVAAFYGYAAADVLRRLRSRADVPRAVACAVCVALVAAACTGAAGRVRHTATAMMHRAAAFDAQSARAERAKRDGARTIAIARLPIANLAVPFEKRRGPDWLAPLIARYYGLASVTRAPGNHRKSGRPTGHPTGGPSSGPTGGPGPGGGARILAPGEAKIESPARALPARPGTVSPGTAARPAPSGRGGLAAGR
ncbi:DUF6056 family protein [Actinomadura gamaensis]|uniref:DUF6056 family protein n=1 Tax=Actinomadura gamaensis TaxID=1763541 RepID=A0ABV9U386_9ACTN